MKMIFPLIGGVLIGFLGSAIGLNGIALIVGAVVILGIINDNLGQALNITLLTAVGVALVNSWVILLILTGVLGVIVYQIWKSDTPTLPHP